MSDDDIPQADQVSGAPHPRETVHLFGQDKAQSAFLEAVASGRLHHGWLISGPRGVGKATLAWRIARFMLKGGAEHLRDAKPEALFCPDDDPVFQRLASLGEPRLALVRRPWDPDRKKLKQAITVDEVRKLGGFFHLSAADGGWRVAIVDAAEDMNTAAANALLKLLEEPPERVLVLLVSHQPGQLLPTIRSRCRTLVCDRLSSHDLSLALDSAGFTMPEDITALQELADGSAGQAIEMVKAGGEELYQEIISTLASLPRLDRSRVLGLGDKAAGRGASEIYALILRLTFLALNRLAKVGATQTPMPEAADGEAAAFAKLASSTAHGQAWAELVQTLQTKTGHAVRVNLDPADVILDMFLKIEATAQKTVS